MTCIQMYGTLQALNPPLVCARDDTLERRPIVDSSTHDVSSIHISRQVDGSSNISAGATYSHDLSPAAISIETLFLDCCELEADFSH